MSKYNHLADLLKRRILNGDYAIKGLPAERQLALENGVAHMTARRALLQLESEGILVRAANGRLEINTAPDVRMHPLQVAFIAPSFASPVFERWWDSLEAAMQPLGGTMRRIHYSHWDDPVLPDTLNGFDGRFILPSSEKIPAAVVTRLLGLSSPVAMLDADLSPVGIPSIRHFPPAFIQKLLDHLEAQGHDQIACLNVQPHDEVIEGRIAQWQTWTTAHGLPALLIDEPVRSFQDPYPRAYEVIHRILNGGRFEASAVFCTTYAAAIGAMRAFYEHRLQPGRDIAIALIDGEGQAAYQIPSLTALEPADISAELTHCLQWMARGGKEWNGPLLMQPADVPLVVRESTSSPGPRDQCLSMKGFAVLANK